MSRFDYPHIQFIDKKEKSHATMEDVRLANEEITKSSLVVANILDTKFQPRNYIPKPFIDSLGKSHATMEDVRRANNAIFNSISIKKIRDPIPNSLTKHQK